MISGIGLDIVEIKRIKNIAERQKKFADRILTPFEKDIYEGLSDKRKIEFLAGRYAAKEAYSKAVGTGIGENLSFLDIQVENDIKGKPFFRFPEEKGVHLTISHSAEYAVAQVIIEK